MESIDEKRLALVINLFEKLLADMGKTMDADAKANAICKTYAMAREDVSALEMLNVLRDILGDGWAERRASDRRHHERRSGQERRT